MGFYTKIDEQIDSHDEVFSISKSISKQNFHSKALVLMLFVFNVFMINKKLFL